MQTLQESAFLQALGFAVINSLWQAALLWIIVSFSNRVLNLSAQAKYRLSITAQLFAFLWFIQTIYSFGNGYAIFNTATQNQTVQNINAFILNGVSKSIIFIPFLSVVYLVVLFIKFIQWLIEYRNIQHISTHELKKIPPEWRIFVQHLSAQFSIKNKVRIYLSDLVNSPLTIGYFKPIILIPLASINSLSAEQMEAVILHELEHIKRADYLLNFLQSLIELSFFFNPFIKLLGRETNKERENTCDDRVLQFQYNPIQYTDALLKLAILRNNTALALQASGNENGELLSRVLRILDKKEKKVQYRNHIISILFFAMLFPYYIICMDKNSSLPQSDYTIQTSLLKPKIFSDNFSLKTGLKFNNPLGQSFRRTFINTPDIAFVKDLPKQRKKSTEIFIDKDDSQLKATTTNEPEVVNVPPASFASYNYISDPVSAAVLTPVYHSILPTPEISAELAYKQSVTDYIRASVFSRQIEDSTFHVSVKGDGKNKENYKKIITIETVDSAGQKHSYTISLEAYQ